MFRGLPLPKGRHCDNAESFKALQARYGKKRRDSSVRRPTKHRSMIRVLDCLWRPGPGKVVDVEATQRLRLVQLSRVIGSLLEDSRRLASIAVAIQRDRRTDVDRPISGSVGPNSSTIQHAQLDVLDSRAIYLLRGKGRSRWQQATRTLIAASVEQTRRCPASHTTNGLTQCA